VYKTDIDAQQQKVVVIGNVSADALVKKLLKTGKHAEPWPEPAPPGPDGSPGGGKKKKKKSKNAANSQPAEPVALAHRTMRPRVRRGPTASTISLMRVAVSSPVQGTRATAVPVSSPLSP
jgi:hypothetical protein